jgi:hypothetical protein
LHATAERDDRHFDTLGSERISHEVDLVGPQTFVQEIDPGGSTGNNSVRLPILLHSLARILTRIGDDLGHRTGHIQQQHTRTAGFRVAGNPDISEGLLFCHSRLSTNFRGMRFFGRTLAEQPLRICALELVGIIVTPLRMSFKRGGKEKQPNTAVKGW